MYLILAAGPTSYLPIHQPKPQDARAPTHIRNPEDEAHTTASHGGGAAPERAPRRPARRARGPGIYMKCAIPDRCADAVLHAWWRALGF